MRTIIAISVGFAILFGISLYITKEINYSSETVQSKLEQVEMLINSDNWDEAVIKTNEAYEYWSKAKEWWAIALNHNTLNSIDVAYTRLQQFNNTRETPHSLAELNTLIILFKDIAKSETLKLNNIF
jgi:hypothetical protein